MEVLQAPESEEQAVEEDLQELPQEPVEQLVILAVRREGEPEE